MEKKHAYLIMAHNEIDVFEKLVSLIDNELHDLYIHIDAKSDKKIFQEITEGLVTKSKAIFIPSINVYWGGTTQIKAELNLLAAAVSNKESYSYYHYLSGVDLPLTTNETRYNFFEENSGKEFIEIQSVPIDKKWEKRAKYYWLFEQKSKLLPYKFLRYGAVIAQNIMGVNRLKDAKYKLQYGSNWVSVTDHLANDILNHRNELELFFDKTHCSDEFLFQTFVNNNRNYNLYQNSAGKYSNARYINWENGAKSGSPSLLTENHIQQAIESDAFFARKFSGQDKQTLNFIEKLVKSK